jgi:hypothetical protein
MEGDASEVVVDGLSFPTAIDFNSNGDAYVTINGVGAPGSGEVVMYAGLINQAGSPLPAPEAPATEAEQQPAQAEQPAEQAPAAAQPAAEQPAALPQAGASPNLDYGLLLILGIGLVGAGFLLKARRKA